MIASGVLADGRWLDATTSTNSVLLAEETPTPYLLGAERQTAGRGRPGKRWISGAGALTFSLAITGPAHALSCGLAACEAIDELFATMPRAMVKWPNDVWIDDRKVAGILIETRGPRTVIGIGLNVINRPPGGATSLGEHAATPLDRSTVLHVLVRHVLSTGRRWDAVIRTRLCARDALRGRPVRTDTNAGIAAGITSRGELIVGDRFIRSGSVRLVYDTK